MDHYFIGGIHGIKYSLTRVLTPAEVQMAVGLALALKRGGGGMTVGRMTVGRSSGPLTGECSVPVVDGTSWGCKTTESRCAPIGIIEGV